MAQSAAVQLVNGAPFAWGADNLQPTSTTNQFGDYTPRSVPGPLFSYAVSSQGNNVLMLVGGTVWGWGTNSEGDLGTGDRNARNVAAQAVGVNGIVAISSGADHALALKSDGTIWAWGADGAGQLGIPPPPNNLSTVPVRVAAGFPNPIIQVAAGNGTSLALDNTGTLWTWGDPLGGTPTLQVTPSIVPFPQGTTIVLVAIGWDHALAVDSVGNLWSWGGNSQGQLGNGTTTSSTTPAVVSTFSGAAAIAAGEFFSLAADSQGRVWAWGQNSIGQLGIGNAVSPQLTPVQDNTITGPVALAAGQDHAFALFSDGSLYGWGDSNNGQVGTGFSADYTRPTLVSISGIEIPTGCTTAPASGTGPNPGPAPPETNGGQPIDENPVTCTAGLDPVNCVTGNYWTQSSDLAIPGRGIPINFQRTYNSLLASQSGRLGFGWTDNYGPSLSFDGSGNPTVHEENGATLPFTLTGSTYSAPTRVLATLTSSAGTFTLTRRDKSQLIFNSARALQKEVDRNGYATTLGYNASSQLSSVTDPAGRQLTLTYNAGGQIASISDPANRSVSYGYDPSANLQSVTDLNGKVTSYTYDSSHDLLTITDPRNGVLTNTYDGFGRVTQQTDPMNLVTTYTYATGSTTVTYPNGNQTRYVYQNNGLANRIDAYGTGLATSWAFTYDNATMGLATVTDPLGNQTKFTWDSSGNLLSVTDPLNQKTTYTYNSFNEVLTKTDALNVTATNIYDANGNLLSTSTPLVGTSTNKVTTLTYDPSHLGDVIKVTDPNNQIWQYARDTYGNTVKFVDPLNDTTTSAYDVVGRKTSSVSPNGNVSGGNPSQYTTTSTVDGFGQVLTATDPIGQATTYTYDADRNLTSIKDANQHTTTYTFDLDNRQTQVTRADNSTLKTSYDSNGNIASESDGLNNPTAYTYDALDHLASMTDALNRVTLYGYSAYGYPLSAYDPLGRVTSTAYDAAGRMMGITYSDAVTPNVAFGYDADNQRTSMTDGSGRSTYTYDSLHRLIKSVNGAGATLTYAYDLQGHLTSITYPGGTNMVSRMYDAAGRLHSVADWNGKTTTFAYDANSNLTTWTYPNSTVGNWTYNRADNLTGINYTTGNKHTVFLNLSYTRNSDNQLTSENTQNYGYDTVSRLVSAATTTYSYDSADELTQIAISGGNTTTLAYDAGNQLNTFTVKNGATQVQKYTYSYDSSGDRTKRVDQSNNIVTMSYDQANRLVAYGTTTTYSYNGDGLRTSKKVGGTVEPFTWNVANPIPTVIADGTTSYVTGPNGIPLEQISGRTTSYYHVDQLGSVRAITSSSGGTVNTYTYDGYGNVSAHTGSLANPFQYSSQYQDAESGFYYLRARYYDPSTEQFVSRDPVAMRTREPYAYAQDTPLNATDPTGLDAYSCQCVVRGDITHLPLGDILRFAAADALGELTNQLKDGGFAAISRLAGYASYFIVGVGTIAAYFQAQQLYSDVHDSDLHDAGVWISVFLNAAFEGGLAGILGTVGFLAGIALTSETGPGAAIGAIIGAFTGGVVGGIIAYLMDAISHCIIKAAEQQRHKHA